MNSIKKIMSDILYETYQKTNVITFDQEADIENIEFIFNKIKELLSAIGIDTVNYVLESKKLTIVCREEQFKKAESILKNFKFKLADNGFDKK